MGTFNSMELLKNIAVSVETAPVRRSRQSATLRLRNAQNRLMALRKAELLARKRLQQFRDQAESFSDGDLPAAIRARCAMYDANLKAIETQIAMVRLAIGHLTEKLRSTPMEGGRTMIVAGSDALKALQARPPF